MRILIIKLSSLGDVVHTLPALTDVRRHAPDTQIDWAIEEAYVEVPKWHAQVDRTIPIALRRWRHRPFSHKTRMQWRQCRSELNAHRYDFVLDAQGLLKSALLARSVCAPCFGYDLGSAREPFASLFYAKKFNIARSMHAIDRLRQLFACALGYKVDKDDLDYGISAVRRKVQKPYVVMIHGSSRSSKNWPLEHWQKLAKTLRLHGYQIKLPWGNKNEFEQAHAISGNEYQEEVLPRMSLTALSEVLASAAGTIACDTGPAHIAAAMGQPMLVLYANTNPRLIGARGSGLPQYIKNKDLSALHPELVWKHLLPLLQKP
jgi:heptosyltransferase-1